MNVMEQRPLADLSLPAAVVATTAKLAIRIHGHVSKFGTNASNTAEHPPGMYNPTAQADSRADIQHFVMALSHTEVVFSQSCNVGLIIYNHGSLREGCLQQGTDRERFFPT